MNIKKLRKSCLHFMGAIALVTVLPCASHADNLLKNGDFATVTGGVPDEWKLLSNIQTVSPDTKEVTGSSKQSLRVDITTDGKKKLGQIVQKIAVAPNKKYAFSFAVKSSAPGTGVGQIKLIAGGNEINRIPTAKSTTEWKTVKLDFESGGADMVWVVLRYDQEAANVGQKIWYADASLIETGAATPGATPMAATAPAASATPAAAATPAPFVTTEPSAVPTFECVGLYWKPVGGATDNVCAVSYRTSGEKDWREALPLWFDPTNHEGVPEHSLEYRGSIVNLKPGTGYEIKLHLSKDGTEKIVNVKTWNEKFPVAKTVTLDANAPQPIVISEGGSKEKGYVVYTAAPGAVFDGKGTADHNIGINASYVILRGVTAKDAAASGIVLGNVQDVVIEGCDVSGWGRIAPDGFGVNMDSAIYAKAKALERVIIQDCKLHNPRSNSNSWTEPRDRPEAKKSAHPAGPQGISFFASQGNFVIRRNKIYSDPAHKFNDSMGETKNISYAGFPNRDTDIYDNDVSNTYDDGIEVEGADLNVRCWNNRIDDVYGAFGVAISSLGPIYIWRNVLNSSRKGPKSDEDSNKGAYMIKIGNPDPTYTGGKIYVFHNTMLQPPPREGFKETSGGNAGISFTGPTNKQSNITSRNNIFFLRDPARTAIKDVSKDPTNDYDYDLYNGVLSAAEGNEKHGIQSAPQYDTSKPGVYPLKAGSPGVDAGARLPNFNDGFAGKAPDVGAFESK